MTHDGCVLRAEKWLKQQGCGIVLREPFRASTGSGEIPDAIGWRDGLSILIECKVDRADFLADKKKRFRRDPAMGMGDWRFFMCPPGVIEIDDLPEGWGLLWVTGKQVRKVHGVPGNCGWWEEKPFDGHKRYETQMLYSALRRVSLRGHFDDVYEKLGPVSVSR
jgi:hypothetical protein